MLFPTKVLRAFVFDQLFFYGYIVLIMDKATKLARDELQKGGPVLCPKIQLLKYQYQYPSPCRQ